MVVELRKTHNINPSSFLSPRQHELSQQLLINKQMSSVPKNAAKVLWALNEKGALTIFEGNAFDGVPFNATKFLGRQAIDVFENHASIVDIVKRGLAGDSIFTQICIDNLQWSVQCYPTFDDKGRISGLVGIAKNISEQQIAMPMSEQKSLEKVLNALRSTFTHADMPAVILEQIMNLFNPDGIALAIISPEQNEALIEAASGIWKPLIGKNLSEGNQYSLYLDTHNRYLENNFPINSNTIDNHAVIKFPLVAQKKQIGALWIANKVPMTKDKVYLAMSIAEIAANALHQTTQLKKTELHLKRIAVLRDIDQIITSGTDLTAIFDTVFKHTIEQLAVHATSILILDTNTDSTAKRIRQN